MYLVHFQRTQTSYFTLHNLNPYLTSETFFESIINLRRSWEQFLRNFVPKSEQISLFLFICPWFQIFTRFAFWLFTRYILKICQICQQRIKEICKILICHFNEICFSEAFLRCISLIALYFLSYLITKYDLLSKMSNNLTKVNVIQWENNFSILILFISYNTTGHVDHEV